MAIPDELTKAASVAKDAKGTGWYELTPRQLLGYYKFARRGAWIVRTIRKDLKKLDVRTEPDFESVWMDVTIKLVPAKAETPASEPPPHVVIPPTEPAKFETKDVAPSHRISRLKAANTRPISVKPTDQLETAVTLMMQYDYSQLPVMTTDREVKGIVSWRSLGNRLALNRKCATVRDCMEPHHELRSTGSMFDAIRLLARHECVLVRDGSSLITGIVTSADISEQFRLLSEPFLLLGDIENALRRLIERSFSIDEVKAAKDPGDTGRKVESAADLNFGEYVRLLEKPENWAKTKLPLDRVVFTTSLSEVRAVRNDVMHFDPDGIDGQQLEKLQQFSGFLERTLQLIA